MTTEKSDSMGSRLDSVLEEIDALKSEFAQIQRGEISVPRISSRVHNLKLINIIKKQHNLIVLLDDRLASLEKLQREG